MKFETAAEGRCAIAAAGFFQAPSWTVLPAVRRKTSSLVSSIRKLYIDFAVGLVCRQASPI